MCNNISVDENQYETLIELIRTNPKILNSSDFLKLNRCVSYMTFVVRELVDFSTAKTTDGIPIFKLKLQKARMEELKDEIKILYKYIKL